LGQERSAVRALALEPHAPDRWKVEQQLELAENSQAWFRIQVPPHAKALSIELDAGSIDLDLFAALAVPQELEHCDWAAASEWGQETLHLTRQAQPGLETGELFLCVANRWTDHPRLGSLQWTHAPFALEARAFGARVDQALALGDAREGRIFAEGGGFATFALEVPAHTRELRIDLVAEDSDLDLLLRPGAQIVSREDAPYFSHNPWSNESLIVRAPQGESLDAGTWYVDVCDLVTPELESSFRLYATSGSAAPPSLTQPIVLPGLVPELGAPRGQLAAIVELAGERGLGSGTWLSPSGWILTNAHVVGERGSEVVIGVTLDPSRAPRDLLRGSVVHSDEALDLALVRAEQGFYGQPLSPDLRCPALEFDPTRQAELGADLWLVGYPATGGLGSRVTISVTRGVVAGFVAQGPLGTSAAPMIKTDAVIAGGNSGGAALDADGRWLGVPTSLMEVGSGQIAYILPLEAVPSAWREEAGLAR
jgi:hypothetical protein